eukprot:1627-Chlamydomonas_euryale.AAC.1
MSGAAAAGLPAASASKAAIALIASASSPNSLRQLTSNQALMQCMGKIAASIMAEKTQLEARRFVLQRQQQQLAAQQLQAAQQQGEQQKRKLDSLQHGAGDAKKRRG